MAIALGSRCGCHYSKGKEVMTMDRFSKTDFLDQVVGNLLALREEAEKDGEDTTAIEAEYELAVDFFYSHNFSASAFPLAHSLVDKPELYLHYYED
jgi:hypothetical protein